MNNLAFKLSFKMENRNQEKGDEESLLLQKKGPHSLLVIGDDGKSFHDTCALTKIFIFGKVMEYLIMTGSFFLHRPPSERHTKHGESLQMSKVTGGRRKSGKVKKSFHKIKFDKLRN